MSEAPADAVHLLTGLVAHMRQVVGEGACYAMLHYGAIEEGKRVGLATPEHDLCQVLARIDAILRHRSDVLHDDGQRVTIRVHSSPLLPQGQRALHGIILGLVEGALSATRHARYKGDVVASPQPGELLLELRREA